MRFLSLQVAVMLAVTASSVDGYQIGPVGPPTSGRPTAGTPTTGGSGGGSSVPWRFTHPENGTESSGNVVFMGTGPALRSGGLSVYSYHNAGLGGVFPSEVQLQIAVVIQTTPGVDWVGPAYSQVGDGFATIGSAIGTPNIGFLSFVQGGGYAGSGNDLNTLIMLNGGQGALFRILEP